MSGPYPEEIQAARDAFDALAKKLAAILDADERSPTWHEAQAFENAGLALGRLLNQRAAARTHTKGTR